jgi:hypothetical protein
VTVNCLSPKPFLCFLVDHCSRILHKSDINMSKQVTAQNNSTEATISVTVKASEETKSCEFSITNHHNTKSQRCLCRKTKEIRFEPPEYVAACDQSSFFKVSHVSVCPCFFVVLIATGSALKSFLSGGIGGVCAVLVRGPVFCRDVQKNLSLVLFAHRHLFSSIHFSGRPSFRSCQVRII